MKSMTKLFRSALAAGMFCLLTSVLSSTFASASVAPLSFIDNSTNSNETIIQVGTAADGNSFRYFISSDENAVPVPTIGTDLSAWTPVTNGESIAVTNGTHIGVAEVDASNLAVDFRDSTAVTLLEQTTPSVSANDSTNTITDLAVGMEFNVDNTGYIAYTGLNDPVLSGIHTVLVRMAAVAGVSNASPAATLNFTFANPAPDAPTLTSSDVTNSIGGLDLTMEISVDSGAYFMYDGSNLPDLSGNHFVLVRVAENLGTDTPAGATTSLFFTANPATPAAPSVTADDAHNTVSGMAAGMEYDLDGAGYVAYNPAVFNLIDFSGDHTLLVRVAESSTTVEGDVTTLNFTTNPATPAAPSVSADDTANTVSGMSAGMEYDLDGAGYVAYNPVTFAAIDFSGNHSLIVRVAETSTTVAGATAVLVFTTDITTPSAPSVSADDVNNVVLSMDTTMEFSVDGSMFVAFDGSNNPNLVGRHTVLVRVAAVSGVSNASSVTTLEFYYANVAPSAPSVSADDAANTINNLDTTMEFSVDGSAYVKYNGSNTPDLSGIRVVLVRVAEDAATDTPAGATTTLIFTTNLTTPAAPSVTANDMLNTIVGLTTDMEFNIDGSGFELFDGSNAPNLAGIHTVQVRVAAVPGVSNASSVTVLNYNYANPAPAAPSVTADDTANVIVGLDTTMEYSIDGSDFELYDGFTILDLTGAHLVIVRVAENQATDTPVGPTTSLVFTTNPIAPVVTGVVNNGYYNHSVTISVSGPNITSVTLDGLAFVSGTTVVAEGAHTLIINDSVSGVITINFAIDYTNPIVSGVNNATYYNSDRTITFSDVNAAGATLNGVVMSNGSVISANGIYTLVVTDLAGNSTTVNFVIDKTNPSVTGVTDGSYNNSDITITFSDTNLSTATLNGAAVVSGATISADGTYVLVITDLAGNSTTVSFVIDKTNPSVTGVTDGIFYNSDVTINFSDVNIASATLNGIAFVSGTTISADGAYTLIVTDLAGNSQTINFTVDQTNPSVTSVTDGTYYGSDVTVTVSDDNISTITLNGIAFVSGTTISADGAYTLIATDFAGNSTTVTFTIDKTNPIVTGVTDGSYYVSDRTITFSDDNLISATLNGANFVSGTIVSDEGAYVLVVTDIMGHSTTVIFTIDKTNPSVTGVTDGTFNNSDVTILFSDTNLSTATLNGVAFVSGTTISTDGIYTLVVTDLAGNTTTVNFTVDKTAPVVTGVIDATYYNSDVTINFTDTNIAGATLNGVAFTDGTIVSAEGTYTLVVTDLAGNSTTIYFVIDKTAPVITGITDGSYHNTDVAIYYSDINLAGATLNGAAVSYGVGISGEGNYALVVTDLAGNSITVNFTIDKTAPIVTGVTDGTFYNSDVTINFTDTNIAGATLNGAVFTDGTIVSAEGTYTLIVTDLAGNSTTVTFTVDKTNPSVTGVTDGSYNNSDITITFSDTNLSTATLNGAAVVSGATISADGTYVLVITDLAGNSTTVSFVIDKTAPVVTGVIDAAYYSTDVTINFTDTNISGATLNGSAFTDGTTVSAEGTYTLVVTDLAGNTTTINFVVDIANPIVTGVLNGSYNNSNVTINFSDTNISGATLNGVSYVSGTTISVDGVYTFIATDLAGNIATFSFTIDKTAPVVNGVADGNNYTSGVTIDFSDTNLVGATLNGVAFTTGTTIATEGSYVLVVTDLAGNTTAVSFAIDMTYPAVTGVTDGAIYNHGVTINYSDDNILSATLNGSAFVSGTTVSADGTYQLIVSDIAGNTTVINFTIDQSVVIVTGVTNGSYYNSDRTITYSGTNIDTVTLDGINFVSGSVVSAEGSHTLVITKLVGGTITINFTIDKTAPDVTGVTDGTFYNSDVTINFTDTNIAGATLNGVAFTDGTIVSAEGSYVFVVTDLAGNTTTINFVIDITNPTVTGVTDGTFYNVDTTITFSDANIAGATLDGIAFASGSIVTTEGVHTLVVTDLVGNTTTISFTIDKTTPVVTGVADGTFYNGDVTIDFTDTNLFGATLNGVAFTSGSIVSTEGVYTLVITDLAGNSTTINFVIDVTAPTATGVIDGTYYGTDVTIDFADANIAGATLDGIAFLTGSIVSDEGAHVLVVTDLAGNSTTVTFTVDKTAPVVTGVVDATYYNTDVTINFTDTNISGATLNGVAFTDGTIVSAEGTYTLVVTDLAGNSTTVTFTVDKTAPDVTGVADGTFYNTDVTINFTDTNIAGATFNGVAFTDGTIVSAEGIYTLVVTDLAGNSTTVYFIIDKTAPVVTSVIDNGYYSMDVTINFTDTNISGATLNGAVFTDGTIVSAEGIYTLVVTDLAGNSTTITFTIDKTAPTITGVTDGTFYNGNVTVDFADANIAGATLDGIAFVTGSVISSEGVHVLVVTDLAGNTTTISFVIDLTAPVVTGATNGTFYNTDVTINFTDTNIAGATLNGAAFTDGTIVSAEGIYTLVVTDLAGNTTTINFTIDKTAPVITGAIDNGYYGTDVTISFTDTNISGATLNGVAFTDGTIISLDGDYLLVVTDLAGNTTTIEFTIDKIAPVVTGVTDGSFYGDSRTIVFSDINIAGANLNGVAFVSGTIVSAEGSYALVVTDLAGNTTTVQFTIDKTAPIVAGVINGTTYASAVTITFSDANLVGATLNGVAFTTGSTVSADGTYAITVTDKSGNVTTVNFTVKAPVISPIVRYFANTYTSETGVSDGETKSTDTTTTDSDDDVITDEDETSDDNGSLTAWLVTTAVITIAAVGAGAGGWIFFRKRK